MFKGFDFELLQMSYIKSAMDEIPPYRPDGKLPADVQAMIDAAMAERTIYQDANNALGLGRGERDESADAMHLACTQVYAIMKARYREDKGSLQAINRLPVDDRTVRATVERGEGISSLWGQLPNPPGSATPFAAWDTMDKTAFDALLTDCRTKFDAVVPLDQDFQVAEGKIHEQIDIMADFTTAALTIGRAQFPEGTPEREVIDAVPTDPSQQVPDQAVINVAESPGPGAVHLEFSANGATSYDVLQKSGAETEFVVVAADVFETTYDASSLPPDQYDYKVIGRNSRGDGPPSDVVPVMVG